MLTGLNCAVFFLFFFSAARREFSSQSGASTSISITLSAAIMSVTVGATDNTTVTETTVAAASVCQVPADFLVAGPVMTVTDGADLFSQKNSRNANLDSFFSFSLQNEI